MSKVGAHVVSGSRNGYGPFCTAKPALILAHGEGGALVEARTNSGGYTLTIFRHTFYKDAPEGIDRMTPAQARALAETHYPTFRAKWAQNPADYYTVLNEPSANDLGVLPTYLAYELRFMELAEVDRIKLCVLNLAGGTPGNLDNWKTYYVPHIKRAFEGGHIYGRHAYGGAKLSVPDGNTNRPMIEAEYLRSVGLGYGGLAITEAGQNGGYGFIGTDAWMADITAYNTQLLAHSNIIGAAFWTLGDAVGFNANWQDALPRATTWIAANPTPKWVPGTPPPPIPTKPKVVILKKPQKAEMSESENVAANGYAWGDYGRTTTHSTGDMITMLKAGNEQSYAILAYPDRASQTEAMDALLANGFTWVNWPQQAAFSFTHWPTSYKVVTQLWGANPDNYRPFGLPGHDGVDIMAPSSSRVMAVASGVVAAIHTNPTSHNYGIHVRINHSEGYQTIYAHLESVSVAVGQSVVGGQQIGKADNTGNSQGSHLHLSLKRLGYTYTDPVTGIVWPFNLFNPEPELRRLAPEAFPQQYGMARYFMPASGDFGQLYILSNSWGANPERCQLQRSGSTSFVVKNSQYEQRLITTNNISIVLDTSPGNGEYYTVSGVWLPRYMSVGQTFARKETIKFFRKADCVQSKPTYTSETDIRLDAHHQTWTCPESGIRLSDVVQLSWFAGGRIDEQYWYANGLGLVRWAKYDGRKSYITELIPVGSQQNNVRETGCFSGA